MFCSFLIGSLVRAVADSSLVMSRDRLLDGQCALCSSPFAAHFTAPCAPLFVAWRSPRAVCCCPSIYSFSSSSPSPRGLASLHSARPLFFITPSLLPLFSLSLSLSFSHVTPTTVCTVQLSLVVLFGARFSMKFLIFLAVSRIL